MAVFPPAFSWRDTLRLRLVLFSLALTLSLLVLVGVGIRNKFEGDRAAAMEQLQAQRLTAQRQLTDYLARVQFQLTELERLAGDFLEPDPHRATQVCAEFLQLHPEFINIAVVDRAGLLRFSTAFPVTTPPQDFSKTPIFQEILRIQGYRISNADQGMVTGRWGCVAAKPLARQPELILAAPIDLHLLSRQLFFAPDSPGLIVSVADRNDTIMLSSLTPTTRIGQKRPTARQVAQGLVAGRSTGEIIDVHGVPRTYNAGLLPLTDWIVVAALPTEEVYHDAWRNFWRALGAIGLVLAFCVLLVWHFTRAISRPVMALADAARRQMAGQSEASAPEAGPVEIAETARAFNQMTTARHRHEVLLQESEHRYHTVINQTGQMVYDIDLATGRITWFGAQAVEQTTGYSLSEFPVMDLAGSEEFIHPDDRHAATARFEQCRATGKPYHVEYRFRQKDGSYRSVEDHGVCLLDQAGRPCRMLGRMSDITKQKQAAEERQQIERKLLETQKLESLGVLAGGIAHDFNNLLTAILGNVGLARLALPGTPALRPFLEQIEEAALRAANLCQQMLACSGKGRFIIQRLDLNDLLRDATPLLSLSVNKKILLRYQLSSPLPAIQADATQVRQVVMNLVINASESLGERNGTITLSTGRHSLDSGFLARNQLADELVPGEYVSLEVSDNGSGIAPEALPRIFDPFFTTKFIGRGLGLAVARGIVRGHKGAIKVSSELDRGTAFRIYLPAVEEAAKTLAASAPTPSGWRGAGRLLVIDDEESVRQVSAEIARQLGFTVDTAADGLAGLEAFQRHPEAYAAVLLDLSMPQLDGEETFRRLRQLKPGVRVVLMSGYSKIDVVNRFPDRSLAGFLQKPFTADSLAAELRHAMESTDTAPA